MYSKNHIFSVSVVILVTLCFQENFATQGEVVGTWAKNLGNDLWKLGNMVTRSSDIKYQSIRVAKKNPKKLLAEVVENIARMMDRKMDAILRILKKAEDAAEKFDLNETDSDYEYFSSKYSQIEGDQKFDIPESLQNNSEMYLDMTVNRDTHFYDLPVNTDYSSVHVPVNVYDKEEDVEIAIRWSKELDEVFTQNYKSDPALSWQYFGSTTGIMRNYPAARWKWAGDDDLFDCRIRTWFIEAATCTKDVLILVDSSGSMQGMGKHIASLTVNSILDTFSNNDYINVMNYSERVDYIIPCFKDMLVQATEENISAFKMATADLESTNKSLPVEALTKAFQLLSFYREKRGCNENSTDCNQAIMLITDGLNGNMSDVLYEYNSNNNGTSIPVRIFTYLIGKEVTNVEESIRISCNNRGYFSQVQSLEDVTASVFKYIPVIARPLVLQGVKHPASWTHAYADITYDDKNEDPIYEKYRLLTSVAVPAFDRKMNRNNETRVADLLGVAGTDVPIEDIERLTVPYKIGVNAYAFMVSNNGYVLMHPDLRPVYKGILKDNYNSIDFTEVEQLNDNMGPRKLGKTLMKLRAALIDEPIGEFHDVALKFHYDDMKRVSKQTFDYYFSRIINTPFTIALAVPDSYGNYSIEVSDEIQKCKENGLDLKSLFRGSNWKIHPKWVYCKYHYQENHEFDTAEKELQHFVGKMHDDDFIWVKQYETTEQVELASSSFDLNLEDLESIDYARTLNDNDYYCNKDLVQRLIFDANNTLAAFGEPWIHNDSNERELFNIFTPTLRFIATMSGLTRWEYISEEENSNMSMEFGKLHSQAIDENWYKAAVLQHQYSNEDYVYSIPFGDNKELVTGSYAIFAKNNDKEVPAAVVGLQFPHSKLHDQFIKIVNNTTCSDCLKCGPELDCYVIDSSGYIIISYEPNDIGIFFGEIQGAVMESMLQQQIFEIIVVYDYQAMCCYTEVIRASANALTNPVRYLKWVINWIISKLVWIAIEFNLPQLWNPSWALASCNEPFEGAPTTTTTTPRPITRRKRKGRDEEEDSHFENLKIPIIKEVYSSCELQSDLFLLNQKLFAQNDAFPEKIHCSNCSKINCSRPYYVKKIPHSNLLLVTVQSMFSQCYKRYNTAPREIVYDHLVDPYLPCRKLYLNELPRRRLLDCFNEHPLEHEITTCGLSNKVMINSCLMVILMILLLKN